MKRNIDTLRVLHKANPKLRKAILANSNNDLVLALCEVVWNILNGTVHLSTKAKRNLSKHKSVLRSVINKSVGVKAKRQLFTQKGGFLAAVLGPALALLATILSK